MRINSVQLTLCRFTVGFLFLLPLALRTLKKREKTLDRETLAYFALLGLLGIAVCMPIYQLSVNYTGSAVVAVLFSCNPVFVTFLAFFLLGEPILPRHIAALVLEVAGALASINPLNTRLNMTGVALALTATVLFSVYGVMGKRKCAEYGGAVVTCFSFLFGSAIIFLFILLTHIPPLAAAITEAGLPSFLAMEHEPASVVSLVYFFKPALSPVLAWALHGEEIPGNMLLGIVLIVAGSCCAIIPGVLEAKRPKSAA